MKKTKNTLDEQAALDLADVKPEALDKTILLIVSGLSPKAVAAAAVDKLGIKPEHVDAVVATAKRMITAAATYSKAEQIGKAITRLTDLYNRSLRVQDIKTALGAQKELNKLMDLYSPQRPALEDTEADDFQPPDDPWTKPAPKRKRK